MRVGFDWNPAFANIAINYRCLNHACLRGDFLFSFLPFFLVKSYRVGRVGAILSAVVGAGKLHLLGLF